MNEPFVPCTAKDGAIGALSIDARKTARIRG